MTSSRELPLPSPYGNPTSPAPYAAPTTPAPYAAPTIPSPMATPSPAPAPSVPNPTASIPKPAGGSGIKNGGKKEKASRFGAMFKKVTNTLGIGDDANAGDNVVLSGPTGFRHEAHIGWDPTNGFEIRNIPPEWRKLFQAEGIKKSELQDGETAKFIMDTVAEATMGINPTSRVGPTGGPPPAPGAPPPPSVSAPPPPPPPSAPPAPGAPPPPPTPGGGSGGPGAGGGLLAGLQTAHLKSVGDRPVPDLKDLNEEQTGNLAATLQKAMAARRVDIGGSDEEFKSDDEWSD